MDRMRCRFRARELTDTIAALARAYETDRVRIERLAQYNAERSRGIMHTVEWRTFMVAEQAWFNERPR